MPVTFVSLPVGQRQCGIGAGVSGIEFDRTLENGYCLAVAFRRLPEVLLPAFQKAVVSLRDFGFPRRYPILFALRQFDRKRSHDPVRNLVLQRENILERAVVALGPDMRVRFRVDQLRIDPDLVSGAAHAALEHVANAELLGNPGNIYRRVFIGKNRVARNDEQAG